LGLAGDFQIVFPKSCVTLPTGKSWTGAGDAGCGLRPSRRQRRQGAFPSIRRRRRGGGTKFDRKRRGSAIRSLPCCLRAALLIF
jgi:hypothetical protein